MIWNDGVTVWLVLAGVLVVAELTTLTFFLLAIAVGCAGGAMMAGFGHSFAAQAVVAAGLAFLSVGTPSVYREKRPIPTIQHPDNNPDIGREVVVNEWTESATARVSYRGSEWDVRFVGQGVPTPGRHVIEAVEGIRLLVNRS